MPVALVAYANGSEDMEVTSVASILDRGGVKVIRAAVTADGSKEVSLSHGMKVVCDQHISECVGPYDMIVIPGGLDGSNNCAANEHLVALLKANKAQGKYLGAICAAPGLVLGAHDLVGEAKATGYPGCHASIKNYTAEGVTIDEQHLLVTGKGPAYSIDFGLACLKVLIGAEQFDKVKQGMLYEQQLTIQTMIF